jgi:hypothetical protein
MKDSLLELIAAAKHVVACWTHGDLAAAVNNLEDIALKAEADPESAAVLPAGGAQPLTAYWLTTDTSDESTDTRVFFSRDERDDAFLDWMRKQAQATAHYHQPNPAGLNFAAGISAPVIAECLDELYAEFQELRPDAMAWAGEQPATVTIPRVVVIVSGGVVNEVLCSDATTQVEILDHDNADTPEARNTLCLHEADAQAELHSVQLH